MDGLLQLLFWLFVIMAIYSYVIYPLVLMVLPERPLSPAGEDVAAAQPSLSIIITAHNEAARLHDKLDNVLALPEYPGQLEVIVASDASEDGTDDIVKTYEEKGVLLVRNDERAGKEAAQALAIKQAVGDIMVFSDVATTMRGDVLQKLVRHFDSTDVGAVSSTDRFIDRDGHPAGEGIYVRYEMWLRRQESRVASLVGLSGSFFAARAEVCRSHWSTTVPSDFMTAVNCVRLGLRAILAEDVIGYYPDLASPEAEYARKVRTVLRGMRAVAASPTMLGFRRFPLFAFQLWSHKIMRWAVPWCLLATLVVNGLVIHEAFVYVLFFAMQLIFYLIAAIGQLFPVARSLLLVRVANFFVLANVAVAHAAIRLIRGQTALTWAPSER